MSSPVTPQAGWRSGINPAITHFVPGDVPISERGGRPIANAVCPDGVAYVDRVGILSAHLGERCPACSDLVGAVAP